MSDKTEPVGKQMYLLRRGAMLTRSEGKVSDFSEGIARLMGDDAFYHDKKQFVDGTDKWYVCQSRVDELIAELPDLSYLSLPEVKMSDTSDRWDCDNKITGKKYWINQEKDWRVIYPTKDDGKTIDPKGRKERTLICPEERCGLELCTKLRMGTRSLARMPDQENRCVGCGKTSDSSGRRESLPEDQEWTEPRRVSPRDYADLHPYIHEHGRGSGSGHGGGGSSAYRTAESVEPEPEYYRLVPQHNPEPDSPEPELPVVKEPALGLEEPAVVLEPDMDRPDLIQDVELPAEDKTIGRRELTKKAWALGALAFIFLVLFLVL